MMQNLIKLINLYQKIKDHVKHIGPDTRGQTLAEYVLAVLFIGLAGLVIMKLFPGLIRAYLNRIYFIVSSPLP